ncbi:MAG: arsenate reductase family protein [Lachnospiraceae bacterium]|nr:arsenate reductase family protein [Lachnospiraceae bacterium]
MLFIHYPKCTTCKKAATWLKEKGVSCEDRHIKENNPTANELKAWIAKSGLPVRKFFNTSGQLYREMNLKDKLAAMTDEEMIQLLSTDGMLVKRPLLVGENTVCVGFKESEWEKALETPSVQEPEQIKEES